MSIQKSQVPVSVLLSSAQVQPKRPTSNGKTFLVVAGLALGGYLVYRHFKKPGQVTLNGTDPVDLEDDHEGAE